VLKIEEWNRMIDVNIRGVLHGIAAARHLQAATWTVCESILDRRAQRIPTAAVYCATNAVWAISEVRRESTDIRITVIARVTETELPAPLPMLKRRSGWRNSAVSHPSRCDRACDCLCDRAASRCGCQRDCRSTDRTERLSIN